MQLARLIFAVALAVPACVVQSDPQAEQQLRSQIPGRYVSTSTGQPAEMILSPDGTGTLNGQPGQWTISMGTLMLSDGEQWVPATIAGDTITIETPEGTVVFQRDDGGGAVAGGPPPGEPGAEAGEPVPAPAAPEPGGQADPRLVGCWEDYTFSSSGGGSGSYQKTLQLGADGSYSKRTFSSVSVGGSSMVDDKREAGSWRVEGEALLLSPREGEPGRYPVSFQGGILYLGGNKHLPCS